MGAIILHMAKEAAPRTRQPQWRRTFIREWREYAGKTLAEMAVAVDYNEGYLSDLEKGIRRYNQDLLEQIADFVGVPTTYLLSRKPPVKGKPLDYSDPALIVYGLEKLPEAERRRIGRFVKGYEDEDNEDESLPT